MRGCANSIRRIAAFIAFLTAIMLALPANAVEPIKIARGDVALDLSRALEFHRGAGDKIQVSTASGPDAL